MTLFTIEDLARACHLFMEQAYPGGADTVPPSKRAYYDIATELPLEEFLPPTARALGVCQDLSKQKGGLAGYEFRLGSSKYAHIKLRIQRLEFHQREVWVYSVNTHDGFHQVTTYLNAAEAEGWRKLVEHNRQLKHAIETALTEASFLTPKQLLQLDLAPKV